MLLVLLGLVCFGSVVGFVFFFQKNFNAEVYYFFQNGNRKSYLEISMFTSFKRRLYSTTSLEIT